MRYIILFIVLVCSIQYAPSQNKIVLDSVTLLAHVKHLSSDAFEGRKTNTEGSKKAIKHIVNTFKRLQVKPLITSFKQEFSFSNANTTYKGTNILGVVTGALKPNKYVVISAHYDHLGIQNNNIFNGADDNASGVAALFAFAEYFKKNPPQHSVILVAFDAEELGFEGSKYYVKHPIVSRENIVFNINMDMISRSEKNELFIVGAKTHNALNIALNEVIPVSKKIKLRIGHDGSDDLEDWTYASDHASFYKKRIPFLYFGVADHKDYHEFTDDYENIHPEFYKEAVHQIIKVFNKIDTIDF